MTDWLTRTRLDYHNEACVFLIIIVTIITPTGVSASVLHYGS